jgi:transposase
LEDFLSKLKGREKVKMVCIDLCSAYRSLVQRYFPNAILVADRFHVVRVVLHHFIQLARELAPTAFVRRGFAGLLRKAPKKLSASEAERLETLFQNHPVLRLVHQEMHKFRDLLNIKHQTVARVKKLIPKLLSYIKKYIGHLWKPQRYFSKNFILL